MSNYRIFNPDCDHIKSAEWRSNWTIFIWAWWIGFAPFVGLFLARISK